MDKLSARDSVPAQLGRVGHCVSELAEVAAGCNSTLEEKVLPLCDTELVQESKQF